MLGRCLAVELTHALTAWLAFVDVRRLTPSHLYTFTPTPHTFTPHASHLDTRAPPRPPRPPRPARVSRRAQDGNPNQDPT
eukprot:2431946-Prymnesium_polylepis.1